MMDTSAYIALLQRDADALSCDAAITRNAYPRYVTSAVVVETHRRLLHDFGDAPALRFLEDLYLSTTHIERPDGVDDC